MTILEALNFVLYKATFCEDESNPYLEKLLENGMAEKLEDLQKHKNNKIYELAIKIIETHFDLEDEL